MRYQRSIETRSELDTQGAPIKLREQFSRQFWSDIKCGCHQREFREKEKGNMLCDGAHGSSTIHKPGLDFSSHRFNVAHSPSAQNPSSNMIPRSLQQNKGLHKQSIQFQIFSAIRKNQQGGFNGVSFNSSQTLAFPKITGSMIDGPQANFSLPTIDRTLPQRTNFRVAAMERHQELLQFFREPTEISARTKLEAVEIDENAETNQTSGANNIRQLPSVEVREAAANAADEASDTNIIRPSLQLRIAGEMEISRRRNQHSKAHVRKLLCRIYYNPHPDLSNVPEHVGSSIEDFF
ncbi:predicted protein [Sclerotinia sclerotiorum 1980 UF-70]|uniref:Uncharacterized protein n=1 Tax=Sclerotinia sclerotiorum (strain ATCC 18683 / 1980 / Ss-1) TaxID=665079 RepID=A7ENJ9_SCLS1|nr:predicted protein [Sclerotinia sclerotiorum 1980 UF-70]EDO04415.1 predicted protein [Sclerotinia sclerotiorum 1980 UF-70]